MSEVVLAALLAAAVAPVARSQSGDTSHVTRSDSARGDSARPAQVDTAAAKAQAAASVSGGVANEPARDTGAVGNPAADTALQRVRSLVATGQTTVARSLVDSLLSSTPPTSQTYASILYTRATLATNADSAEKDYRRVIVEYAASPQASDALLRLAQLELARGDREQAALHLSRLTREQLPNQTGIAFARTQLQVGLAYFDLQDTARACAALVAAHTAAPTTDVELRNRIDYNTTRCPQPGIASNKPVDSARAGGGAPASHGADTAKTATGRGGRTTPAGGASHVPAAGGAAAAGASSTRVRTPAYTVQVAAYQTHDSAQALVSRLSTRAIIARIYGAAKPYRVRIGRFANEAQADSAQLSLKRKGIAGFVTPAETNE